MRPKLVKIGRRTWPGFAALAICAASIAFDRSADRTAAAAGSLAFPRDHAAGLLYASIDRWDLAEFRELYAPADAIAALKAGNPLPIGTVLTMVNHAAKRDPAGEPLTDARGRFVKGEVRAILVMEKRAVAPTRRPSDAGESTWRFEMFRPDASAETRANLRDCAVCHQKRWSEDSVFTLDEMKNAPGVARH